MSEKRYEIGGATYVQRPLVLGQIRQLMEQLEGLTVDPSAGEAGLVSALGDRLPLCLAVVLTPEGQTPRGKDLPALADELEFAIAPEQVLEVVDDFFDCNPVASLVERLTGAAAKLSEKIRGIGSKGSVSSSPAATSPAETGSSGASPSPSASPGSATEAER